MRYIKQFVGIAIIILAILALSTNVSLTWGGYGPLDPKPAAEKPGKQTKEPAVQHAQCELLPEVKATPEIVNMKDPCLTKPCIRPFDPTPVPKTPPEPPHSYNPTWEKSQLDKEIDAIKETNGNYQPLNEGPSNVPKSDWGKPVRPVPIKPGRVPRVPPRVMRLLIVNDVAPIRGNATSVRNNVSDISRGVPQAGRFQ